MLYKITSKQTLFDSYNWKACLPCQTELRYYHLQPRETKHFHASKKPEAL